MDEMVHIGEVANRTALSLRTIRHYHSVGLVVPSGRSEGGFRLYTERDVQRLLLVRALKPAEFSLEELQEVLTLGARVVDASLQRADRSAARQRLTALLERARQRFKVQRERLIAAELAVEVLRAPVHDDDDIDGGASDSGSESVVEESRRDVASANAPGRPS